MISINKDRELVAIIQALDIFVFSHGIFLLNPVVTIRVLHSVSNLQVKSPDKFGVEMFIVYYSKMANRG